MLEREGVPASYLEYLQLLTDVFAECARKLEPGGRIAVNVANLGRRPYRSLAADITTILQDDLGLLLRGALLGGKLARITAAASGADSEVEELRAEALEHWSRTDATDPVHQPRHIVRS